MNPNDLATTSENTWCPGCPNNMILASTKKVVSDMINERKFKHEDFAITTDIGCNSKIFDYLKVSGVNALHGRALPLAIGMKIGNPKLKVMAFVFLQYRHMLLKELASLLNCYHQ